MHLYHLPAAGGIIATISLIIVLMNRRTGFESIGTFVWATAAFLAAWVCTLVVLLVLVKNGGFVRGLLALGVYLVIGYACLRGIIEITNSGMEHGWAWPCVALATGIPMAVNIAAVVRK